MRQYDYSRFADWPEFDALARAMDDFAHRLDREQADLSPRQFSTMAGIMVANLRFSDSCPRSQCESADRDDGREWAPYLPHTMVETEPGRVLCAYRCRHGHRWTCGWSVEFALMALP